MKDKDGFTIKCKHCDWMIFDNFDNKDYMCLQYHNLHCYGDDKCKYYIPERRDENVGSTD